MLWKHIIIGFETGDSVYWDHITSLKPLNINHREVLQEDSA